MCLKTLSTKLVIPSGGMDRVAKAEICLLDTSSFVSVQIRLHEFSIYQR